jgi:RNA polymerase sigma factor (sigma-70 family)
MLTANATFQGPTFPSIDSRKSKEPAKTASAETLREFDNLVTRYLPRLQRIALRSLRNIEDAEDVVQETMLLAFRYLARFDRRSQMSTWVTSILMNAIRMQIRRRSRAQMLSLDQSPVGEQRDIAETIADPGPTPEQNLEQSQLRKLAHDLTVRLPRQQRTTLRLRFQDELSIQETAKLMGVPQGTVKARTTRARAKLMERFDKATSRRTVSVSKHISKPARHASTEYRFTRATLVPAFVQQQAGQTEWVSA